jgi:hypothetical protein
MITFRLITRQRLGVADVRRFSNSHAHKTTQKRRTTAHSKSFAIS